MELSIPNNQVANVNDDLFDSFTQGQAFLPRLQLYTTKSDACAMGKIPPGHYALAIGETLDDCGDTVNCFALAYRFKALDITTPDTPKAYFNPQDDEFKRVRSMSEVKDSHCMCGPEFLLYIPDKKKFATFFMYSKTARREAPNVRQFVPTKDNPVATPLSLKVKVIKKNQYVWQGTQVTACSYALNEPDPDTLAQELHKFLNPDANKVDVAVQEAMSQPR